MAQLCQHRDELLHLNAEVLLISFSSSGYARAWSKEVCPSFRLLLDRERMVYRIFGLEQSLSKSWSLGMLWSYIRLMRAGRKWRGIQGNSIQLGGDFIVGADGVVRMAYRSHDPTDRPAVDELLLLLRQLEKGAE